MATGLSIGKLTAVAGVNIETIRYCQRCGLLDEPPNAIRQALVGLVQKCDAGDGGAGCPIIDALNEE